MNLKSNKIVIVLLLIIIGLLVYNTFFISRSDTIVLPKTTSENNHEKVSTSKKIKNVKKDEWEDKNTFSDKKIDVLTAEDVVVTYLKKNAKLPAYYISKKEAHAKGWIASKGNLCDVLPGRAIGGDIFSNREKKLPIKKDRLWFEADLNYKCGNRNADRIVFSNDGLIYVTYNHYSTFEKK